MTRNRATEEETDIPMRTIAEQHVHEKTRAAKDRTLRLTRDRREKDLKIGPVVKSAKYAHIIEDDELGVIDLNRVKRLSDLTD